MSQKNRVENNPESKASRVENNYKCPAFWCENASQMSVKTARSCFSPGTMCSLYQSTVCPVHRSGSLTDLLKSARIPDATQEEEVTPMREWRLNPLNKRPRQWTVSVPFLPVPCVAPLLSKFRKDEVPPSLMGGAVLGNESVFLVTWKLIHGSGSRRHSHCNPELSEYMFISYTINSAVLAGSWCQVSSLAWQGPQTFEGKTLQLFRVIDIQYSS